jgi:hypothetical protein
MAKKAKKAKKSTKKAAPAGGGMQTAAFTLAANHPDTRYPVHNDPNHEIVCKWIGGRTQCRQVPTGGDWTPGT